MGIKGLLFTITSSLLSASIGVAGDVGHDKVSNRVLDWKSSISIGAFSGSQGKAEQININTLIANDFSITKGHDSNAFLGLGYFSDWREGRLLEWSYGLNAFYLPETEVTGNITQEGLFTNLSYQYDVSHIPVYLVAKAKVILPSKPFSLIFDAGIGPNFMKTGGYGEDSLDGSVTMPDNTFTGARSTGLSMTAGVGIELGNALGQFPLECGYRFFYLGEGQLKANKDEVLNHLRTGSVFANAVLCSVRI
jgi:hypothetical protein